MDLNRKTAYEVLVDIENNNSYSNLALNKFILKNKPEKEGFVRELVYGVLENKILLDYYLDSFITKGISKQTSAIKSILRLGIYQILFLDSVPDFAAVNEMVNLTKRVARGKEGFVNGVLRSFLRKKKELGLPDKDKNYLEHLSIKYSFSKWIVELLIKQYPENIEEILKNSNIKPKLSIRVNGLKCKKEELERELEKRDFRVSKSELTENSLFVEGSGLLETNLFKEGLFSVQDQASIMAIEMLDPKPGDMVIDTCAAPGGKSQAIAERMENQGKVISCDIYSNKLELIKSGSKRLGIDIIDTEELDATKGKLEFNGKFDKVLCDAPCSGLGVIRHKPEIKYKKETDFNELVAIQKEILNRSKDYLKPGGELLYSTCTINKNENEIQIKDFLDKNKDFKLVEERQLLPEIETDGFYMAKLVKEER